MRTPVWQPGVDRIAALVRQPTDLVSLWRTATGVIAKVVPHYSKPCWYTVDPASLLITSHVQEGLAQFPAEWLAGEYYNEDVIQINDVLRSTSGLSTLHEAAGGDPSATKRWQRNMMMGGDQELLIRLRSKSGPVWGVLGLYREPDRPLFSESEKAFLKAVAPHLADGARRALLIGEATDPEDLDAPGLLIITELWEVESATPGVSRWMSELPDGDWNSGQIPSAVLAVAAQALRSADGRNRSGIDIALELSVSVHTVQEHLKSVVDKTGVRSRRDLVAMIFYAHYEPRFRDNERRTVDHKPVRGQPYRSPDMSDDDE